MIVTEYPVMAHTDIGDLTDEQLLSAARCDGGAFGVFYDRYEQRVLAFFYRATRRSDIAADLTAEVFAAALGSLARFDPQRGTAAAWLFGIARHELADTWRRGQVEDRMRRALALDALALSDESLCRIEAELAGGDVLDLLGDLPPQQRAAIEGRVLEDLAYPELADRLQCSPSVVRQRVSRGLRSLRARLEQSS